MTALCEQHSPAAPARSLYAGPDMDEGSLFVGGLRETALLETLERACTDGVQTVLGDLFPEELPRAWPTDLIEWYAEASRITLLNPIETVTAETAAKAPIAFLTTATDAGQTRAVALALQAFAAVKDRGLKEETLSLDLSMLQTAAHTIAGASALVIACEDPALEGWVLAQAHRAGVPTVLVNEPVGSPARYCLSGARPDYLAARERSLRVLLAWLNEALCAEPTAGVAAPNPSQAVPLSSTCFSQDDVYAEALRRGLESKTAARLFTPGERWWIGGHPLARRRLMQIIAGLQGAAAEPWVRWWKDFELRLLVLHGGRDFGRKRVRERVATEGNAFIRPFLEVLQDRPSVDRTAAARALESLGLDHLEGRPLLSADAVREWSEVVFQDVRKAELTPALVGLLWLCGAIPSVDDAHRQGLRAMPCLSFLKRRHGPALYLDSSRRQISSETQALQTLLERELSQLESGSEDWLKLQRARIAVQLWLGESLRAFRLFGQMTQAYGFAFRGLFGLTQELVLMGKLRTASRLIERADYSYVYRVESRLLFCVGLTLAGATERALHLARSRRDAPPELQQATLVQARASLPQAWLAAKVLEQDDAAQTFLQVAAESGFANVFKQLEASLASLGPDALETAFADALRETMGADVELVLQGLREGA
ncbi:MAG: hypothetical protein ACFB20_04385 [Opitutales bacterium]